MAPGVMITVSKCEKSLLPPQRTFCFYRRWFVCLQDYPETTQPTFSKFGGKVAHGQRKKALYLEIIGITLRQIGAGLRLQTYSYG